MSRSNQKSPSRRYQIRQLRRLKRSKRKGSLKDHARHLANSADATLASIAREWLRNKGLTS